MKAVMKYPGAKWSIAQWIIDHFPHHLSYLEPFFGSGAVLMTKPRSAIETVNDLDGDVVNFFEWVKRDPERLAYEVYWTPFSRVIYQQAKIGLTAETDSFKRAVYFYERMMMGYGFRTGDVGIGWKCDVASREKAYAALHWCEAPELIQQAAERMRGVQIECTVAQDLIPRFNSPDVLIYADPPYVMSSRSGRAQYKHEMTDADHKALLEVLLAHKGPVILSGYDSPLYNDALAGWYREEKISRDQAANKRREVLWLNYEPQITLFEEAEHEH